MSQDTSMKMTNKEIVEEIEKLNHLDFTDALEVAREILKTKEQKDKE